MLDQREKNLRRFRGSVQAIVEGATPVEESAMRFRVLSAADRKVMLRKLRQLVERLSQVEAGSG